VCAHCKAPQPVPAEALIDVGFDAHQAEYVVPSHGKGCDRCNNTGYKGRIGLYEVMEITEQLRELILVGGSALELRRKALDEGMVSLRQSGLRKIADGVTTIEEVVRETMR
jgi:type IV pilus assembly protein PilB